MSRIRDVRRARRSTGGLKGGERADDTSVVELAPADDPSPTSNATRLLALVGVGLLIAVLAAVAVRAGEGAGAPLRLRLVDGDRPPPQPAVSATPLGRPRLAPPDWGSYAFLDTQTDGVRPVAWDPCRPIPYVVNARAAPDEGLAIVAEAVEIVAGMTGLQFVDEGAVDEVPSFERRGHQPERYGDRWAPVLIAWSDETAVPELAGDVAGVAATLTVPVPDGDDRAYVSGLVVLDGPQLGAAASSGARNRARAVLVHELAHLVGLDHVDDPEQLMHPIANVSDLGYGDQRGLIALATGACFPFL